MQGCELSSGEGLGPHSFTPQHCQVKMEHLCSILSLRLNENAQNQAKPKQIWKWAPEMSISKTTSSIAMWMQNGAFFKYQACAPWLQATEPA